MKSAKQIFFEQRMKRAGFQPTIRDFEIWQGLGQIELDSPKPEAIYVPHVSGTMSRTGYAFCYLAKAAPWIVFAGLALFIIWSLK